MTSLVPLPEAVVLLVGRFALLLLLYLFLLFVISAVWADARAARSQATPPTCRFFVIDPGATSLRPAQALEAPAGTGLGRDPDNLLVLDDETVSGHHAEVRRLGTQWWLYDRGSRNGTFVNRTRLRGPRPLEPGDEVQLGQVLLRFQG